MQRGWLRTQLKPHHRQASLTAQLLNRLQAHCCGRRTPSSSSPTGQSLATTPAVLSTGFSVSLFLPPNIFSHIHIHRQTRLKPLTTAYRIYCNNSATCIFDNSEHVLGCCANGAPCGCATSCLDYAKWTSSCPTGTCPTSLDSYVTVWYVILSPKPPHN